MNATKVRAARAAALIAVFLVALFGCAPKIKAPSARVKYVAIVETEVDAQSGASAELNPAEVRQVTAELRREAVKTFPRGKYNIMTSETVIAQGGAVLDECADENCVIILGSKIGADYIVRGTISKLQTRFTLSVEMYETENGNLVASSDPVRSESVVELLEMATVACASMYRAFLEPQRSNRRSAQPAPPPRPQAAYQPPAPSGRQPAADGFGTFTDGRDGKVYKTTAIGGNTWMAENLNIKTGNSWCYDDADSNCAKYGRLYDWETAMAACPAGWHLPSRGEWDNLGQAVGGERETTDDGSRVWPQTITYWLGAANKLKAKSGWYDNTNGESGNGADGYGFSAPPGGRRSYDGKFEGAGDIGYWWTDARHGPDYPYLRKMGRASGDVFESYTVMLDGLSVRCFKDGQ